MTIASKQFSLLPKGSYQRRSAAHLTQGVASRPTELAKILWAKVGQFVLLTIAPDVFDGVEFRGVSRQTFQLDPSLLLGDKVPH